MGTAALGKLKWRRRKGKICKVVKLQADTAQTAMMQLQLPLACTDKSLLDFNTVLPRGHTCGATYLSMNGCHTCSCSLRTLMSSSLSMWWEVPWTCFLQMPVSRVLYTGSSTSAQWPMLSGNAGNGKSISRVLPPHQPVCME